MQGKGEGITHGRKVTSMPASLQDWTKPQNYVHTFWARREKEFEYSSCALLG